LADKLIGFAQNFFERQQAVTCHFSIELCENSGKVATNRKEWIKIQKRNVHTLKISKSVLQLQKLLVLAAKTL
jgi:hypothetical protein